MGYHCLFKEHITLYFIIFLKILASKNNCYFHWQLLFSGKPYMSMYFFAFLFLNNLRKKDFYIS